MTELTKLVEKRHGPFKPDMVVDETLILRGPYKLDNSAVYEG
jgi:hypothetical protein